VSKQAPLLDQIVQLGEPTEHRGIVVAPLYPRLAPGAAYITLEDALARGFTVTEVSDAGRVPELAVENPLGERVLLYDGEELLGAKQNRILNVTVLVEAGSTLPIPVSCVEEGRWSRRSRTFAAAPHAPHPELRRRKAASLDAAPMARGAAQHAVWDEVSAKAGRMGASSRTGANEDTFRSRASDLKALEGAFPLEPGQSGAVLALGDRLCLDWVSRPEAFVELWPKLRAGYLLDALERLDRRPATLDSVEGFLAALGAASAARQPSAGLGDDVRLRGSAVIGSGLELGGELLQLSAFTTDERRARSGRIARPSRRR